MADRITQAEPDRFAVDILKDRRVKSSFETIEYYTMKDACVRTSQSRPYNTYPLIFKGFIFKIDDKYYRMLRTPIPSYYSQIQMSDKEIEERVRQELVLTSWDALEAAYKYADQYLDNPGWLVRRKDLENFFNKQTEKNVDEEHTK